MDVNSVFKQVGVDPDGASRFAYRLGQFLSVDFRLQFGWRGSTGSWGLITRAIWEAQRKMTPVRAAVSLAAATATAGEPVVARTGYPVAEIPVGCEVPPAEGGGPEDAAWVIFFMDDAISVEVQ